MNPVGNMIQVYPLAARLDLEPMEETALGATVTIIGFAWPIRDSDWYCR